METLPLPRPVKALERSPETLFAAVLRWLIAPLVVVVPISMAVTYLLGSQLANMAFDRALASQVKALAEHVVWDPQRDVYRLLVDLPTLLSNDDVRNHWFRIDGAGGELILGSDRIPPASLAMVEEQGEVTFRNFEMKAVASGDTRSELRSDTPARAAILARVITGADAVVVLQLAETTERRAALAREITQSAAIPQFVLVPLSVLLLWVGLRRGLAPLKRLHDQVAERDVNDLRPLTAPGAPQELSPLIEAFNQLLARVENNTRAQKRFIANAAHQLRTPLAGVRMQTELALRSTEPQAMIDALHRIATGSERSTRLVNQLLTLARAEADAEVAPPFVSLDLRAVARAAVEDAIPQAIERATDLGLEVPDAPVEMRGDALLLRELIANLVDNAIRYAPTHGRVTVRIVAAEPVLLEVEDDGPGIAEAERNHVFERFYRAVGTTEPGTGIGLAIVREIAARHHAEVEVLTPHVGHGTLLRVSFRTAVSEA